MAQSQKWYSFLCCFSVCLTFIIKKKVLSLLHCLIIWKFYLNLQRGLEPTLIFKKWLVCLGSLAGKIYEKDEEENLYNEC